MKQQVRDAHHSSHQQPCTLWQGRPGGQAGGRFGAGERSWCLQCCVERCKQHVAVGRSARWAARQLLQRSFVQSRRHVLILLQLCELAEVLGHTILSGSSLDI